MLNLVNISRIVSLKLSNTLNREQIHSINNVHPMISFTQIRSLTFDLLTANDLEEIVDILPSLIHLESLAISSDEHQKPNICLKLLYRLRNVKRLRLFALGKKSVCWANINIQRWSLDTDWAFEHLQINPLDFQYLGRFLHHLPQLRSIETTASLGTTSLPYMPNLSSCILLVSFNEFSDLTDFLRKCPNLKILKLETSGIDAEYGEQWEKLFKEALSRLQCFKLVVSSPDDDQSENRRATFESRFWIQRGTQINSTRNFYDVGQDDIRTVRTLTIEFG